MIRSLSGPGAQALGSAGLAAALAWLAIVALAVPRPLPAQESEAEESDDVTISDDHDRSAWEILEEMLDREQRRGEGVDFYTKTMAGNFVAGHIHETASKGDAAFMEKVYCKLPSGETRVAWRGVSKQEAEERAKEGNPGGMSELLRNAGDQIGVAGAMFNEGMEDEGVPAGMLFQIFGVVPETWEGTVEGEGGRPARHYAFNVLNPGSYFAGYGVFFNAMADVADMVNSLGDTAKQFCRDELARHEEMARDLEYRGREQRGDGGDNFLLEAMMNETFQISGGAEPRFEGVFAFLEDRFLSSRPTANPANLAAGPQSPGTEAEMEFTVRKFTLHVDTEHYVPLNIRIEGIVTEDGQPKSLPVIIEKENRAYRQVPGSEMLLPYLEVMRIWGFTDLGPEMEEAQREMAKLEAQLAELPDSQRKMIEKTMGNKIQAMKAMAEGGAMVYENRVEEVILNLDLPLNPSSAANPIVLECMPGDTECVEPDMATTTLEPADAEN